MELDVVPQEPTVLEYARLHGLCIDYTSSLPDLYSTCISDDTFDQDLQDHYDTPALTGSVSELIRERLTVTTDTALLLHRSIHLPPEEQLTSCGLISDGRQRILGLKQEIPLLLTDHELDMLRFGSRSTPSFCDMKIPMEAVDEEKDEGLGWPSNYSAYPAQWHMQAELEKFAVPKESLIHLQETLRDQFAPQDMKDMLEYHLNYRMTPATRPLTPPLLPLTPPISPYIPSSPANQLPLLSEDSNSTAAEARCLQDEIMAADALFTHESNENGLMLFDTTTTPEWSPDFEVSEVRAKRKADDLKVEGPLTPPMCSDSPAKKLKSVSFSAMVQFIPELPSTYENGGDILCPEDDFAGFYQDTMPLVEEANRRICNERLVSADTTRRVDVPYLDLSLLIAPWDVYKRPTGDCNGTDLDAQMKFLLHVKRFAMKTAETWHGVAKLEKDLRWDPAPAHMSKITVDEKLHGEESIGKLLSDTEPSNIITCSSTLWHRDRLRILEDDGEEEELEYASYGDEWIDGKPDLSALARKRKLEFEEADDDVRRRSRAMKQWGIKPNDYPDCEKGIDKHPHSRSRTPVRGSHGTHSPPHHPRKGQAKARANHQSTQKEKGSSLMFGGKFSATNSLENFLAVQGMSIAPSKITQQAILTKPPLIPVQPKDHTLDSTSKLPNSDISRDHHLQQREPAAPPPSIPEHLPPCSFIISSTLLQNRHLSKQIEKLYPMAEFVSRDFDLPHSAAPDADLLLSPSTGLILSTLQQVKQRALPGQPDHSPLKTRIANLQHRYERLLVMVTEGLTRDMESHGSTRPPDPRNQEAIQALESFAARSEADVLVRYIPGGETALARSIVIEMAAYGLPHGSPDIGDIKPLPDETNWELFLRRVGLNPFAAQAILAWLKDPLEYPLASSSPTSSAGGQVPSVRTFGLQTFLMMSVEQRVQSFQAVLGGSRVLRKVSAVLDGEWVSAVHGFRV